MAAIEGAKAVFDGLNKELFNGKLEYNLDVYAPQYGTLTIKISYETVKNTAIALAAIVTFLDSPTPTAYIKNLVGKTPVEYASQKGEEHNEALNRIFTSDDLARMHSDSVRGFLEKEPEELSENGISKK